jgi:Transposase DDE domain
VVLESLIGGLKALCATLPDRRKGDNTQYTMADIAMAAFATFFMQSPSFLAQQTALARGRGTSNCQTLFAMDKVPSDNHIRTMLDAVPSEKLLAMFGAALTALEQNGGLVPFQRLGLAGGEHAERHVLIALDGTEYFCSQKLSCPNCSSRIRGKGIAEHFHQMVSAALVAPGHDRALPLEPEFIMPQDGADKQDCESRATARWLAAHGPKYARLKPIYLGDDLASRQPTCEAVIALGAHFLFTAKPSSHKTLYEWLDGVEIPSMEQKIKQGARFVTYRYRWMEAVPIRDGDDALIVNWLEIEIVDPTGKVTYRNSFVTNLPVTKDNVVELAACGRSRWKIENENFNTLKTKGYNLEHNFGHGSDHLSATLAALNLIAFAFHTVADLVDAAWKDARTAVGTRKRFFEDLRALTTYLVFPTWAAMIETLRSGLPPPADIRDG